jgi:glycerol-1-phosphate dehydrogenase [NAD(P)+]
MPGHWMELPRLVLVSEDALERLEEFLARLALEPPYLIVSGPHVGPIAEGLLPRGVRGAAAWYTVLSSTLDEARRVGEYAHKRGFRAVLAVGGGKTVDVGKMASKLASVPFVSVPTSASHDGIASPFASLKGSGRPYSMEARSPLGILADLSVIARAPRRYLLSGCADLLAKLTAVRDWQLASEEVGEYYGSYAAKLAELSAKVVIANVERIAAGEQEGLRCVVEALISAGVAASIAGSSRPCSGSEHLVSHALDLLAPGRGLHGEKCGIAAALIARLQGLEWRQLTDTLKQLGAPSSFAELGIDAETVARALELAPRLRPERYTILHKLRLTRERALGLVKELEAEVRI